MQNKRIEKGKEIMSVAKMKECSEKEVWEMGVMEYYNTLAVLESYNKDVEQRINEQKNNKTINKWHH